LIENKLGNKNNVTFEIKSDKFFGTNIALIITQKSNIYR